MGFPVGRSRGRPKKLKRGRKKQGFEAVIEEDFEMPVVFEAFPSDEAVVSSDCILDRARRMREVGEFVGVKFHGSEEQVLQDCMDYLRQTHPMRYETSWK